MNKFSIILIVVSTSFLYSQSFDRKIDSFSFFENGQEKQNVFSGGANNLEHQFIDIDADNDLDLFYLCSDGSFEYLENLGNSFDPNFVLSIGGFHGLSFNEWFFFLDIDNDEDYDLFTGGDGNTITYWNNIGNKFFPEFVLQIDTLKDESGSAIFSDNVSNPVFADLDNDSDYDFYSGNQNGTVTYYENIGNANSFSFSLATNLWQNIQIVGGGLKELHGASSLEFGDLDGDQDFDLLWGDFFSRSLYYLENQGNPLLPDVKLIYEFFPQNEDSVLTSGFNMPRLADIDSDGDPDLFVSVLFDPTVNETLLFFENNGTSALSDFSLVTKDYINTLDVGTKSTPVFTDIDDDDDLDLFIGNERFLTASIFFYENMGNRTFELRDTVYSNITDNLSLTPEFGDLDGDGDFDLLVGNFQGKIFYYQNIGSQLNADFQLIGFLPDGLGNEIQTSNFARPKLIDIDNDSNLDLVVGAFNGKVILYRNTGSAVNFNFVLDDVYFESIDVGDQSNPYLFDIDNDSDLDLFCGNRAGNIFYYENIGSNISPSFSLITDSFIDYNLGRETALVFADLDNDSDQDLFIGNIKGGLYYFENQFVTSVNSTPLFEVNNDIEINSYPNPFNSTINIKVSINSPGEYAINIFDILGRKVKDLFFGELQQGEYSYKWDGKLSGNAISTSGVYFISVEGINNLISVPISFIK